MEIQLVLNGEESGPHSLEEVQTLLANGDATLEDYAWFDGCADWITIAEIPGISDSSGEEIEAEESEAPSTEENADIYIWPDGAEDWVGPNTLAVVQEMIANGEAAETDYAAFEGSSEGATVADIPGFSDAQNEAIEESIEEDVVEEEPVPAKKGGLKKGGLAKKGASGFGAKKGGLKKGGLAKKGASGFGAKKSGGTATKKGAVKKAAKEKNHLHQKLMKKIVQRQPTKVYELYQRVLLILGIMGNTFLFLYTFLGSIGEGVAEVANKTGKAIIEESETDNEKAKEQIDKGRGGCLEEWTCESTWFWPSSSRSILPFGKYLCLHGSLGYHINDIWLHHNDNRNMGHSCRVYGRHAVHWTRYYGILPVDCWQYLVLNLAGRYSSLDSRN